MPDASKSPQTLTLFPEKLFYKIGEVSRIVGIEPFVLRYWESEFPFLSPRKSKSGQRLYTRKEIDLVLQIQELLYVERYTIDGVRKKMGASFQRQGPETPPEERATGSAQARVIRDLVTERLRSIIKLLT
jgi:DNA-binding transcriptional MerR regulator